MQATQIPFFPHRRNLDVLRFDLSNVLCHGR
jgi:hypothetical protein